MCNLDSGILYKELRFEFPRRVKKGSQRLGRIPYAWADRALGSMFFSYVMLTISVPPTRLVSGKPKNFRHNMTLVIYGKHTKHFILLTTLCIRHTELLGLLVLLYDCM